MFCFASEVFLVGSGSDVGLFIVSDDRLGSIKPFMSTSCLVSDFRLFNVRIFTSVNLVPLMIGFVSSVRFFIVRIFPSVNLVPLMIGFVSATGRNRITTFKCEVGFIAFSLFVAFLI